MDAVHKAEYKIRDLGTRSVTLFPTRAQIVREIKDLPLKPGQNEITIVGLTPTVDEHSIKVEGTGSAIISDIAVELLPNREIFQEIYPESEDESEENESEEDEDEEKDSEALKTLRAKMVKLRDDIKTAKEVVASAESRLKILDAYGKQLDRKRGIEIQDGIETYRTEREKVFQDHMAGIVKERELSEELTEAAKEEAKLLLRQIKDRAKANREKVKAQKAKDKEKQKKARREAERLKEKARIRKERESFWPRLCYSVRVTLDATSFTPASSRRGSISSDIVKVSDKAPEPAESSGAPATCDLILSYVTTSAFWAPSYDLQLSTTANTALLCFDAQLTNATSESWNNCKVTLSTSEATFAGLQDAIPTLTPWRIKLAHKNSGIVTHDLLNSREERNEKVQWTNLQLSQNAQKPRANLFGNSNNIDVDQKRGMELMYQAQMQRAAPMQQPAPRQQMQASSNALFGGLAAATSNSFGAPVPPPPPQAPMAAMPGGGGLFGSSAPASKKKVSRGGAGFGGGVAEAEEDADYAVGRAERSEGGFRDYERSRAFGALGGAGDEDGGDDRTVIEPQPALDFQESAIEESGLTTTYDLPGLKTLVPRPTASKQRVARLNFTNVVFSHTVIAKYKPVAYLKAKLRNNSKLNLLRGAAGLTLDGSFMGRTSLPRCSAGDSFSLSLGIDPAIKVVYPKPEVRRATTGMFSKEDSSVYTRTVTIVNTRAAAGKPISLLVLDQVPVSEDERLRVEVLAPKGITIGGAGVPAGLSAKEGKDLAQWGKATATLKKGGEVSWDVSLNAGRAVKLGLEYVVALPSGDHAIQC